jgi:hypothetical protein
MSDSSSDNGVIVALIVRFERERLPRLLKLKEKTNSGGKLTDADIAFLDTVIHDAQLSKHLMDRHPEWQSFCAKVLHLYDTITETALNNEKPR